MFAVLLDTEHMMTRVSPYKITKKIRSSEDNNIYSFKHEFLTKTNI